MAVGGAGRREHALKLHRIDHADSSDTIVAGPDDLAPIGPQSQGLTPYYFLDRTAVAGSRYSYHVSGKFSIWYRGEPKEITSNSEDYATVASLPIENGILSLPAPNPFQLSNGGGQPCMRADGRKLVPDSRQPIVLGLIRRRRYPNGSHTAVEMRQQTRANQ